MREMELIQKWLKKAEDDLIVARHLLNDLHPQQIEISCFHSQQAAEKALKAFLLYKGVEPPKTHNLVVLCQNCSEIDASFDEKLEHCVTLTKYGIITRYPSQSDTTEEEAYIALHQAEAIYDYGIEMIPELKEQKQEQGPTLSM